MALRFAAPGPAVFVERKQLIAVQQYLIALQKGKSKTQT
jgi:hypothetical protein